jgi:purine-binding chemotaxis protein CheW
MKALVPETYLHMTSVLPAGEFTQIRSNASASETGAGIRASWLLCRTGAQLCAIPIEHVIETMRVLPIEAIARAPRYVRGLCIIRGSPVPVVDPGLLFGEKVTQIGRLVVIRTGGRTISLAVEAVLGIRAIGVETFNQLPPLLRDGASDAIDAIGTLDAELLFVLRAARIVPDDVFDRVNAKGTSS